MASPYTTVSHGSMEVTSNTSTEEQIREALEFPTEADEASEAASKLGKRGGKAAAEARKAKQDEETTPPSDQGSDKGAKAPEAKEEKKAAPEQKAEEKPDSKDEAEKKHTPRKDSELRKAEIAGEIRELTEKRNALRRQVQETDKPKPAPKEEKPADSKPDWEQYEAEGKSFQQFLDDTTAHAVNAALQKERAERAKKEALNGQLREIHELHDSYSKRMDDYAAKHADFEERLDPELMSLHPARVLPPDKRQPENYVYEEIVSSEKAPELLLYFSERPKEFQRLATLHPRAMLREIARIEVEELRAAATAGNPAPKAPDVSQAKPPVRPVTGSPHTADDDDDPEKLAAMPLNRYVAFMNAKERRAQR